MAGNGGIARPARVAGTGPVRSTGGTEEGVAQVRQQEPRARHGATPQLAGSVLTWADRSPPRPDCSGAPPRSCDEGTLFGGTVPARTWFATMSPLHDGLPVAALPDAPAAGYRTGGLGPPED